MAKKATKKAPAKKKAAARKPRTTKTKSSFRSELPSEALVRERAYEISLARTGPADPVADWFQAEQELKTELHA